jgi:hypothetical protein
MKNKKQNKKPVVKVRNWLAVSAWHRNGGGAFKQTKGGDKYKCATSEKDWQ